MFKNNAYRTLRIRYFFPSVKVEDYNVRTDGRLFFDQLVRNDLRKSDKIQRTEIGQ